jgi:DNA modification methylase
MKPYYQDEQVTLYCGDNLEVMSSLAKESISAIVTDPPYGLSNGGKGLNDIFLSTIFNVHFPKFNEVIAKFGNGVELGCPFDRVTLLNRMNRAIWVEPGVGVPETTVHLQNEFVDWNKEIEHAGELPPAIADSELMDKRNAHRLQNGDNFYLKIRGCLNSSFSDSARCGFTELGFGRFGMAIVIPFNSCFASFLRSLSPSSSTGLADVIGLLDNPAAFAQSPASVMASGGTELRAMLTYDTRNGTFEIRPTSRTDKFDVVFELICPKDIRTISGASSLAAMFKPNAGCFIGDAANRTFTLNIHDFILPYIARKSSGFMGKEWDAIVPSVETWRLVLDLLKPGGHLLSFAGTRTQHRMAVNIEDAGFEIRDMIAWVYGSGFPKSLDVSKAIDKAAGAEGAVIGERRFGKTSTGQSSGWNDNAVAATGRQDIREPATDAAKQWQGWGTALKPALEPITVARKPFKGTVASNVLEHGTGGLNIDGCRVESGGNVCGTSKSHSTPQEGWDRPWRHDDQAAQRTYEAKQEGNRKAVELGRWPANLIHDGSDEVVGLFPVTTSGGGNKSTTKPSTFNASPKHDRYEGGLNIGGDTGSAARFFYCAKASKRDRNEGCEGIEEKRPDTRTQTGMGTFDEKGVAKQSNHHPTVKPTDLMAYLCRLITPPSGLILDPFMGSGSTGKAAVREGFRFIGIEQSEEYCEIALARIKHEIEKKKSDKTLFD